MNPSKTKIVSSNQNHPGTMLILLYCNLHTKQEKTNISLGFFCQQLWGALCCIMQYFHTSYLLEMYSPLLCTRTFQFPRFSTFHLAAFSRCCVSNSFPSDVWSNERFLQLSLGAGRKHCWHLLEAADLLCVWARHPLMITCHSVLLQ